MKDVARAAGVSLGTVSNVLNNPQVVTESTRQRVLEVISELGFIRNSTARSLAVGRVDNVGFVIVDLANSFFLDITRGVESVLDERGIGLLLANSDVEQDKQDHYLEHFEQAQLSGIILAPLDGSLAAAEAVRSRGVPVVNVNWPGDQRSCGVISDDEFGGYLAAKHLIEQGCKRLMFAGGPHTLSAISARLSGAQRAVAEADGVELEFVETERITVRGGHELGRELIDRPAARRPDGLFAASDALAVGTIHELLVAGLHVPDDLLVVGYDNNHLASDSAVPITTVGQPGHEMGRTAARLLLEEIESGAEHEHQTVVMRPTLIRRSSSDPTAQPVEPADFY
ncbi:LacI family DNA-binding transcriptional regulator [Zhihengliuella somnathii]